MMGPSVISFKCSVRLLCPELHRDAQSFLENSTVNSLLEQAIFFVFLCRTICSQG
jgi:hypothetical protein